MADGDSGIINMVRITDWMCVRCRAGSADSVLPMRGDDTRLLHTGVHRQLHGQCAGHVPEGGSGEG